MIDFIKELTFWQWYWADVVLLFTLFVGVTWAQGTLTAKEFVLWMAATFIPVINFIMTCLGTMAIIIGALEEGDEMVIWRRKKGETNVD